MISSFVRELKFVGKICTDIVNILKSHARLLKKGAKNHVFEMNLRNDCLSFEKKKKITR